MGPLNGGRYGQVVAIGHGRPQADFFPGGQEPTFCLINNEKDTFFPKTSKNILFLAGRGGGGARAPLALPCGRPCYWELLVSSGLAINPALHNVK